MFAFGGFGLSNRATASAKTTYSHQCDELAAFPGEFTRAGLPAEAKEAAMGMQKLEDMSNLSVCGVDISKDAFPPVGFDAEDSLVLRRKIKRLALGAIFEALSRCVVGTEARLSARQRSSGSGPS